MIRAFLCRSVTASFDGNWEATSGWTVIMFSYEPLCSLLTLAPLEQESNKRRRKQYRSHNTDHPNSPKTRHTDQACSVRRRREQRHIRRENTSILRVASPVPSSDRRYQNACTVWTPRKPQQTRIQLFRRLAHDLAENITVAVVRYERRRFAALLEDGVGGVVQDRAVGSLYGGYGDCVVLALSCYCWGGEGRQARAQGEGG